MCIEDRALGVTDCLLLVQEDDPTRPQPPGRKSVLVLAEECKAYLEARKVNCRPVGVFVAGAGMQADISRQTTEFTQGVAPERVVLDIKPGTKRMTYTMSRVARPGNWLFNLEAGFLEDDRRNDPGTERPEIWQVTADLV